MTRHLEPDREQIEELVDTIFRHAGDDGFIAIRSFIHDGGAAFNAGAVALNEGHNAVVEVAFRAARHAAQHPRPVVFCPPLAVLNNRYQARAEDVLVGPVLTAECDKYPLEARRQLELRLGRATLVAASGRFWTHPTTGEVEPKLHLHWRLRYPTVTPEQHALLYEARRMLCLLVDCDPTNAPIAHPIRWPGSWHRKQFPRMAEIIDGGENEIDLNAVVETLRALVGAVTVRPSEQLAAANPDEVTAILRYLPNHGDEGKDRPDYDQNRGYHRWNNIGLATFAASQGSEAGRLAFHMWSAKAVGTYNQINTDRRWRSYQKWPPNRKGHGSLIYEAWQHYMATVAATQPPPDWLLAAMQEDRGKGSSFNPSDVKFGRGRP